MSNSSNSTATVNVGGGGLILFAILLILKVNPGGHLDSPVEDWSWWIITAPLWFGIAVGLGLLVVAGIVLGIGSLFTKRK